MKMEATAQLLLAIHQVRGGEIYLSPAMHTRLAQRLATSHGTPRGPLGNLSEREFEVLHLIGLGFGTRQIAERLNRSVKTIEAHRANIKDKLNLPRATDLVRFAVQWLDAT
jgi:DNA-binding NarL/FixJ family response regulator